VQRGSAEGGVQRGEVQREGVQRGSEGMSLY
jgi:hypothetical protein